MRQVAVIGAGRIGTIHAGNAHRHEALALKYVVDPVASAAEQLAGSTGAQVASVDDVLADAGVEGVIVASSTDTHL
jgi:myo-inositol 2-dehydrogenase/D-chiro-inositol 1-dehydrogenase